MYYANCEWYVDMGEHNKPLCERKGLRPAKCSECPVYIGSIEDENAKLRELASLMYRNMQGVLDCSTDTVFANSFMTLRDHMDECMEVMAELCMPPRDYESRRRELGWEY